MQLPVRLQFRNEFLYVSVTENKKDCQQEAEEIPWKSSGTSLGRPRNAYGSAAAREQGDQQVPVCSWGTIKPSYKLSQE